MTRSPHAYPWHEQPVTASYPSRRPHGGQFDKSKQGEDSSVTLSAVPEIPTDPIELMAFHDRQRENEEDELVSPWNAERYDEYDGSRTAQPAWSCSRALSAPPFRHPDVSTQANPLLHNGFTR